jgi:hypothetical protein
MLRSGTVYNHTVVTMNKEIDFEEWKQQVNNLVFAKIKINCYDLPDENYWFSWDDGMSSESMANLILKGIQDEMMDILQDKVNIT